MAFNVSSTQGKVSSLNRKSSDKAREYTTGHHDPYELPTDAGVSGGMNSKISSTQKTPKTPQKSAVYPTHSQQVRPEKEPADRNWSQGPPLSGNRNLFLPSPSTNDQSQLHRRNNRHRKTSPQSGKENIPLPPLLCQPGRTSTTKARRPVLANITNVYQGGSESFDDVPFASSTSVQSPSRKVANGEPGAAGLKIELDHKPFLDCDDSQGAAVVRVPSAPIAIDPFTELCPESSPASPNTPLREALAVFNNILSSTFTPPAKKPTTGNDTPDTFRLSVPRLPNAFNLSTLADSLSQLTEDFAASITTRCEEDYLYHGQYHEDAVARDETFHWEEEMKFLEIRYGL